MAEGVTYADLRFAKSSAEKSRTPGDAPPEERSDGEGELTYENFPAGPRPRQPAGPGPHSQPPDWQVSRQLEGAAQRHTVESGTLAQQLGTQEENLTQTLQLLSQAQAELSATRLALQQSREAGKLTLQQLERERKQWELAKSGLQEEKAEATQGLEAAKEVLRHVASCQQTDCCPLGWKPFRQKCLWISSGEKTWEGSKEDCESEGARLLILDPWDAAVTTGHLRSGEFWIGLYRTRDYSWEWRWVDGTHYTGKNLGTTSGGCAKVSQGTLEKQYCNYYLRYVCEKAATPFSWTVDQSA